MSIKDPSNYLHNFALVPCQWASNWQDDIWDPNWLKPLQDTPLNQ